MFGDRLKEVRIESDLSQEEFGKKLGVLKSTVSNWENNRATPTYDMLCKIADIFKVSIDHLLGNEIDGLEEIEQIKRLLKQSGLMVGDDLTMEELEKALKIVNMLKENK